MNLDEVARVAYSQQHIEAIRKILSKGTYWELDLLETPKDVFCAELVVVRFNNEKNKK